MNSVEKELFEKNDLTLLHSWFEEGKLLAAGGELSLPQASGSKHSDLWTKTIHTIDSGNKEEMQSLYFEIENSRMPRESRVWWLSLLSIAMGAPPKTMEQFAFGNKLMPKDITPECIAVAARILADYAARKERYRRAEERWQEERKLHELKKTAEEKRLEKATAEANLQKHSRQGNRV